MPRIPSLSPATGRDTQDYFIHTVEGNFVDNHGRTLLLRGVNLSGSSKQPVGQPSYLKDGFWEGGETGVLSFKHRPLNVDDGSADVHLARLRGWGFNMLRFPVSWEALEHEGPGKYDYDFMDYTIRVLKKCRDYGFRVLMDPHQDVWSRFSGGSGAPFWTLHACGIDPRSFTANQTALLHSEFPSVETPDPQTFPAMIWSTNYGRLASQTLFTLFFAGRDYAPKCVIDGVNIQDYLQSHFIAAFGALADRIRDEAPELFDECIIGWDSMNEPAEGFCGYEDLNIVPEAQGSTLRKGSTPTPAQSLRLGMGQEQTVDHWAFGTFGPHKDGTVTIDPKGYKMWLEPDAEREDGYNEDWGWRRDPSWPLGTCIWALHGVWDIDSGVILKPRYFESPPFDPGRPVVFVADYWRPHWQKYILRIRQAHPEAIAFIQPPVFVEPAPINEEELLGRCCYSTHYYDGLTLVTRHWNWFNADALGLLRGKYTSKLPAVKIGERAIRKSLRDQLGMLKADADILGPYPTLIGEIGTPYDMDGKKSYGWTDSGKYLGDYTQQQKALDASLNAADGNNALNYTIWTYCADSSHKWGDGWNMEDLSLWSSDDQQIKGPNFSTIADASTATLLKKFNDPTVRVRPVLTGSVAGSSSLSLATIDVTPIDEQPPRKLGEMVVNRSWDNPYDFLTDGARAVRAFARPFPTAVVGVPTDINFDIAKAEFQLTVRVKAEDRPPPRPSTPSSSSSTSTGLDEAEALSEYPTEIYLPLVHYASSSIVAPSMVGSLQEQVINSECEPVPRMDVAEEGLSKEEMSKATTRVNSSAALSTLTTLSPTPALGEGNLIDVAVRVSAGKWEVQGQTLRWWYPMPAPDSQCEMQHNIQIRRALGPIKTRQELAPSAITTTCCDVYDSLCSSDKCCIM